MLSYRRESALQGALWFWPKKWKTSIFKHCDMIGLKIYRIRHILGVDHIGHRQWPILLWPICGHIGLRSATSNVYMRRRSLWPAYDPASPVQIGHLSSPRGQGKRSEDKDAVRDETTTSTKGSDDAHWTPAVEGVQRVTAGTGTGTGSRSVGLSTVYTASVRANLSVHVERNCDAVADDDAECDDNDDKCAQNDALGWWWWWCLKMQSVTMTPLMQMVMTNTKAYDNLCYADTMPLKLPIFKHFTGNLTFHRRI